MPTITKDLLELGKSSRGGWNARQLRSLGFDGFEYKWKRRAIGKHISNGQLGEFLRLKDAHIRKKRENKQKGQLRIPWKDQYSHPLWQRKRLEILKRDGFACRICGNNQAMLHVHHSRYDSKLIWECSKTSMISLCEKCHKLYHEAKERAHG